MTTLSDILDRAAGKLASGLVMQMHYSVEGVRASGDLMPFADGMLVTRVEVGSESRGDGHGSTILAAMCAEADRCGQTLYLEVSPDGTGHDYETLVAWYGRYGFVAWDQAETGMVRTPAAA